MEQMPKEDNDPQLLGEAKMAMKEIFDMNVNAGNALSLYDRVDMLNADQRHVFDNIKSHLVHQVNHENGKCQCSDLKPLTMFISGVGGTGKSYLIETIKELVNSLWSSEDVLCAVAAPTGLAAFNNGGITMHRLFRLPIEHPDKAPGFWPLSKDSQKAMRTTLRNLKMLIIDEVSMVSSLNLAYINPLGTELWEPISPKTHLLTFKVDLLMICASFILTTLYHLIAKVLRLLMG